jgi:NAD(P)-dependent dehydrogenase (short-subunit alcohol dehydrogenase family)
MTNSRLASKTALITGATSNIGRAIAAGFAAEGAHVVASGRSPQRGAELIEEIKANGGRAEFVPMDLDGTPQACGALAAEAARLLGSPIDILVNNLLSHTRPHRPATGRRGRWPSGNGSLWTCDSGTVTRTNQARPCKHLG